MGKHSKPSMTSTMSRHAARGAAGVAVASAGLLLTGGAAMAHTSSPDVEPQNGLGNAQDGQLVVPIQGCNNNVPVNVLGVQVPVVDNSGLPILSGGSDFLGDDLPDGGDLPGTENLLGGDSLVGGESLLGGQGLLGNNEQAHTAGANTGVNNEACNQNTNSDND